MNQDCKHLDSLKELVTTPIDETTKRLRPTECYNECWIVKVQCMRIIFNSLKK